MQEPVLKRRRRNVDNPLVFFDIDIGSQSAGKIVFELFSDVVPKVMSFMAQEMTRACSSPHLHGMCASALVLRAIAPLCRLQRTSGSYALEKLKQERNLGSLCISRAAASIGYTTGKCAIFTAFVST